MVLFDVAKMVHFLLWFYCTVMVHVQAVCCRCYGEPSDGVDAPEVLARLVVGAIGATLRGLSLETDGSCYICNQSNLEK